MTKNSPHTAAYRPHTAAYRRIPPCIVFCDFQNFGAFRKKSAYRCIPLHTSAYLCIPASGFAFFLNTFFWNKLAKLYDGNLKLKYNPSSELEDFFIEDIIKKILENNFNYLNRSEIFLFFIPRE